MRRSRGQQSRQLQAIWIHLRSELLSLRVTWGLVKLLGPTPQSDSIALGQGTGGVLLLLLLFKAPRVSLLWSQGGEPLPPQSLNFSPPACVILWLCPGERTPFGPCCSVFYSAPLPPRLSLASPAPEIPSVQVWTPAALTPPSQVVPGLRSPWKSRVDPAPSETSHYAPLTKFAGHHRERSYLPSF